MWLLWCFVFMNSEPAVPVHTASPCQAGSELEQIKQGHPCHEQVTGWCERQAVEEGALQRSNKMVLVKVKGNW